MSKRGDLRAFAQWDAVCVFFLSIISAERGLADRNESLNSLAVPNFARVDVTSRIDGDHMEPEELTLHTVRQSEERFDFGRAITQALSCVRDVGRRSCAPSKHLDSGGPQC